MGQTLEVVDKVIHLAFNSNNDLPVDGTGNNGAGIMVDGIPQSIVEEKGSGNVTADDMLMYQKSFLWHDPMSGIDLGSMGAPDTTVVTNEPYWELKGGQLRITATLKNKVTFGFRINHHAELELFKTHDFYGDEVGRSYAGKRIALRQGPLDPFLFQKNLN